jgi:hypothetical protein
LPVLRAIVRLLTFVLLVILALAGAAALVAAVTGGDPDVARALGLTAAGDAIGGFLTRLETGRGAVLVGLLAVAAILLGLLLLIGALVPSRERKFVLLENERGRLCARRGALGDVAAALVAQPRRIAVEKVKARPARRGVGGRLVMSVASPRREAEGDITSTARQRLTPLTDRFRIRARVRTGRGHGGERVS